MSTPILVNTFFCLKYKLIFWWWCILLCLVFVFYCVKKLYTNNVSTEPPYTGHPWLR